MTVFKKIIFQTGQKPLLDRVQVKKKIFVGLFEWIKTQFEKTFLYNVANDIAKQNFTNKKGNIWPQT